MKLFLDTSAFAKRYVSEPGSDKLLALCDAADHLIVSVICLPELISTLSRLVREKKLAKADYRKLKSRVTADLADAEVWALDAGVLMATTSLLEAHPLRAMDALHLACALASAPDKFVSADHRQLAAARKAGLTVVDVS
ncbi:MAG: type II toxin-antitoxin system VapC family toxin [Aeromicrobium sp.]|nr:type II toxin-antitoxin system VapC family toxin [Burkholderiales bacterium]